MSKWKGKNPMGLPLDANLFQSITCTIEILTYEQNLSWDPCSFVTQFFSNSNLCPVEFTQFCLPCDPTHRRRYRRQQPPSFWRRRKTKEWANISQFVKWKIIHLISITLEHSVPVWSCQPSAIVPGIQISDIATGETSQDFFDLIITEMREVRLLR